MKTVLKRWKILGDKNTTILKHLHQVLYLINVGLNDDFQNQSPDFIRAFDANGLYDVLNQVNPPKELKELLSHTKSRIAEARSHLLGHKVQADISKDDTTSSSTGTYIQHSAVWNFHVFSITQILRETNYGESIE